MLAPGATPSQQTGFVLGRTGGNIRPFTVAIAADGRVTGARTVRVHGECVPLYTRLWKPLTAAVNL